MEGIEIRPLEAGRLDDYVWFMEHDAFRGNPDWEGCYCLEAHSVAEPEEDGPEDERRREVTALVGAGRHTGLLAYQDGRVVGWCHAEPLAWMQNPEYRMGRSDAELEGIGGIVCFNLAESHRRHGLPGVLLREAIRRFAADGFVAVEAFPWKEPSPRPGRNYLGTVQLYEIHGFVPTGETEDAVVMRRDLAPGRSES